MDFFRKQFSENRLLFSDRYKAVSDRVRIGEFNYLVNVSLKHSYVYIEQAKSGCTFVKKLLANLEFLGESLGPNIPAHFFGNPHVNVLGTPFIKPFQLKTSDIDTILSPDSGFYIFSVCRNPYTRSLSAYLDKIKYCTPECESLKRFNNKPLDEWLFSDFLLAVKEACLNSPLDVDKHWRPQSWMLDGLIHYPNFGLHKVESSALGAGIIKAIEKWNGYEELSLPALHNVSIQHARNAANKINDYMDHLCIDLIREIYREDFLGFSYSTNLP